MRSSASAPPPSTSTASTSRRTRPWRGRFQSIPVDPPTNDQTIEILKGLRERYEQHHRVRITDEAVKAAVELSGRYISGRVQPDKSIDVIDEAGARVRIKSMTKPPNLADLEADIERLSVEKDEAVKSADYERAAELRDKAEQLRRQKEQIQREWREKTKEISGVVDEEVVAEVVSKMTGVPLKRLEKEEAQRLLELEKELHKKVVSQDDAIKAISKAIRRARAGLKDPKRPMGSFIFCGPSGVGKTLVAKSLAEFMFGDEDALIVLDMSEYMEKHNVSRLVGAPPGYVGYEEGGQLTERVRRRPYSVILLDEVEKAHPDVFNMLLQIMEEGRLTDSFGRNVDFKNTILIMTSNIGADLIKGGGGFGVRQEDGLRELRLHQGHPDEGDRAVLPPRVHQPPRRGHRLPSPLQGRPHQHHRLRGVQGRQAPRGPGDQHRAGPEGQGLPHREGCTTPTSAPAPCVAPWAPTSRTRSPRCSSRETSSPPAASLITHKVDTAADGTTKDQDHLFFQQVDAETPAAPAGDKKGDSQEKPVAASKA